MIITGNYMPLNDRYLKHIGYGDKFLLGVKLDERTEELINEKLKEGGLEPYERMQSPNINGFVSKFNGNHYDNLNDYTTVGTLNIMLIHDKEDEPYLVVDRIFVNHEVYVDKFYYDSHDYNNVKLAANLLLELFKTVETLNVEQFIDLDSILVIVPWEILPAGMSMQEGIKRIKSKKSAKPRKENTTEYIDYLKSKNPVMIAKGKENYSNYYVFKFESSTSYILEPIESWNATYIINGDWREITKYNRAEIRGRGRGFPIIHDGFELWKKRIKDYV